MHFKDRVYIRCYDIEEDAAHAYQDYVEHGTLPARKVLISASRGIAWSRKGKVWRAQTSKNGNTTHLAWVVRRMIWTKGYVKVSSG